MYVSPLVQVYFRNNSARLGNDIYAYSFSPCTGSQMLPEPRGMMQKNITHSSVNVASGAAWMFLSRVTCPCLKPVLNSNTSHWWFTRSSSREQVWDVIRKNNESYPYVQYYFEVLLTERSVLHSQTVIVLTCAVEY